MWRDPQVWMENLSVTSSLLWLVKCKLNLCLISSVTHRWCWAAEMRRVYFPLQLWTIAGLWPVSDSDSAESRRKIKEFFFHYFSTEFTWCLCLHSKTARREISYGSCRATTPGLTGRLYFARFLLILHRIREEDRLRKNHMLRSTTSVILNLFTENVPFVRVGARVWHHWTKVHFIPSDNSNTTNNRDVVKDQSSLSQEHCDHPVMMTKGENTDIYKCLNTDIDILS